MMLFASKNTKFSNRNVLLFALERAKYVENVNCCYMLLDKR